MATVKDYKVLETKNVNSMTDEVCAMLKEGWQPLGHCVQCGTATSGEENYYYNQTMVIYES